MYLESIFMASEDIQKQLPNEAKMFDEINTTYKIYTERIYKNPNALDACRYEGILETLQSTDEKLQKIQKELDAYLETKRMIFPRFYFLSNDDLLEILGQQKEPANVQRHIKKCFEGIKAMQLIFPGKGNTNRTIMAQGMDSPDGEKVSWNEQVVIDGPVELWLVLVEKMMIETLRKMMPLCVQGYKGKKEKWVKEFEGQCLITGGQIVWTTNCTKALNEVAKGKT